MADKAKYKAIQLSEFLKGSGILVISNVILKAAQLFLLPLYTRYLTPDVLGNSDSIIAFAAFIFPLLVLAFDSAFSVFYYNKDGKEISEKVFNTTLFFWIAQSMFPFLLQFQSEWISSVLFDTEAYAMGIRLSLIGIMLNLWFLPFALLVRMRNQMKLFAVVNMLASLSMLALNIIFVSVFQWGYISLIASTCIVNMLQLVLYIVTVKVKISKNLFDKELFKRMFQYALPMLPMTVCIWVLNMSDRAMMQYFCGAAEVGLYGVGTRFVTVVTVIITGISTAYTAFAFKNRKEENAEELFSDVVSGIFVLLAGICTTIAIFGKDIVALMASSEYEMAYKALGGLMFAKLLYGMNTFLGYGIAFKKKSKYFFYAVLIGAVVNVVINLILLPTYGIQGAAMASLLGQLFSCAFTYYYSVKLYPCDYGIRKIVSLFLVLVISSFLAREWDIIPKVMVWISAASLVLYVYRMQISKVIKVIRS